LLEAMALKKPIIATAVGGVPEVVREGDTGFLLHQRDAAALAALIVRIANDATVAQAMGAAGYRRYVEQFTAARMIAKYEDLYRRVMQRHARIAA
jgi:glycosyltransferase involved in cell wall biosynthesis